MNSLKLTVLTIKQYVDSNQVLASSTTTYCSPAR